MTKPKGEDFRTRKKLPAILKINVILGFAFLIFGLIGLFLLGSGFSPSGVVFVGIGLVNFAGVGLERYAKRH